MVKKKISLINKKRKVKYYDQFEDHLNRHYSDMADILDENYEDFTTYRCRKKLQVLLVDDFGIEFRSTMQIIGEEIENFYGAESDVEETPVKLKRRPRTKVSR